MPPPPTVIKPASRRAIVNVCTCEGCTASPVRSLSHVAMVFIVAASSILPASLRSPIKSIKPSTTASVAGSGAGAPTGDLDMINLRVLLNDNGRLRGDAHTPRRRLAGYPAGAEGALQVVAAAHAV